MTRNRLPSAVAGLAALVVSMAVVPAIAGAHPMSGENATYVQGIDGAAIAPFMYLGAKHMVTGYDHLLFLVGVIFFLYRMRDVVLYVSLFTLGHSLTLLGGVLGGLRADPYVVDAIIALSVVYKAFDNLDGFQRIFGFRPDTRAAVLVFGLVHGFGLATRLQGFDLARKGLITNLISFNVGVEIGQVLALSFVLIAFTYWRTRSSFLRHAFVTNTALMSAGFILAGQQVVGYLMSRS
jgi:hypothetical protein